MTTIQDVIPLLCKLENGFGFVGSDCHLLSATVLSPDGLKWLRLERSKNIILDFQSEELVLQQVKDYLGLLITEVAVLCGSPAFVYSPAH